MNISNCPQIDKNKFKNIKEVLSKVKNNKIYAIVSYVNRKPAKILAFTLDGENSYDELNKLYNKKYYKLYKRFKYENIVIKLVELI